MNKSLRRIEAVLQRMRGGRVTVFGDFCVDAYWTLCQSDQEISLETGLPVNKVRTQRYSLGGAGCVLANLAALGVGNICAVGVVGSDPFGDKLRAMLQECGAEIAGLLTDLAWQTMVYAKPYLGEQEKNRIDFGAFNEPSSQLLNALLVKLEEAASKSDVVILNQQVHGGLLSPEAISRINAIIVRNASAFFLVDSRHYPEMYKSAALKINMIEAARVLEENAEPATDECAREFALSLHHRTGKPAFLTRGEFGMVVAVNGEATLIPGLQVIGPTDTVGAGDAVVAALGASLAAGASSLEAATIANIAGMITVRKLRMTGTASADEIHAIVMEQAARTSRL